MEHENEEILWRGDSAFSADITLSKFNWPGDPKKSYKIEITGAALNVCAYVDLDDLLKLQTIKL